VVVVDQVAGGKVEGAAALDRMGVRDRGEVDRAGAVEQPAVAVSATSSPMTTNSGPMDSFCSV